MADHHRPRDPQPLAEPGQVVGEPVHGVVLLRLVAGPVAAEIDRHHTVRAREIRYLRREIRVVAAPAVDQDQWRVARAQLLVGESNPVAHEPFHAEALAWINILSACRRSPGTVAASLGWRLA